MGFDEEKREPWNSGEGPALVWDAEVKPGEECCLCSAWLRPPLRLSNALLLAKWHGVEGEPMSNDGSMMLTSLAIDGLENLVDVLDLFCFASIARSLAWPRLCLPTLKTGGRIELGVRCMSGTKQARALHVEIWPNLP